MVSTSQLRRLVGAVGIELLFNFIKSRVFTVLPTASQINWSQMELTLGFHNTDFTRWKIIPAMSSHVKTSIVTINFGFDLPRNARSNEYAPTACSLSCHTTKLSFTSLNDMFDN